MNFFKNARLPAVLLFCVAAVQGHPGDIEWERVVPLESRDVPVRIVFAEGREGWAEFILDSTSDYLRACEQYLRLAFPASGGFTIVGEEKTLLRGRRVGGVNLGREVRVEYGLTPIGRPALLYHELAHYYFGGRPGLEWLAEGIVSFLPIVLSEARFLPPGIAERQGIYRHWGFRLLSSLLRSF